jgi:hypothetical protein
LDNAKYASSELKPRAKSKTDELKNVTFSPPIPGTPVRLVHHQFPVHQADDLLNFPLF